MMSDNPKKPPAGSGDKSKLDAGNAMGGTELNQATTIVRDQRFNAANPTDATKESAAATNSPGAGQSETAESGKAEATVTKKNSLPGLAAGQKVGAGRFTLVRELGRGGMGIVWLARDARLREDAALKFLPPEVAADAVAFDDLRRETQKSRRLAHPNIIRIHDLYEAPGELPFIFMEFVNGSNLTHRRLQQPQRCFTWEFLRPLVMQLCAALEYAHGEKIIHRDLKPSNLMLDSQGRLKLADFGIAATMTDSMSRVSGKEDLNDKDTSGTLLYMSPQQIRGARPKVADDIYSLGATLYELLTGKPPFSRGSTAAIMEQIKNEPPCPISEHLEDLGPKHEIPGQVSATIMACLAKEGAQRPRSAQAIIDQLQSSSSARQTLSAEPPTAGTQPTAKTAAPTSAALPSPAKPIFPVPSHSNKSPLSARAMAGDGHDPSPQPARHRNKLILVGIAAVLIAALVIFWPGQPKRDQTPVIVPKPAASNTISHPAVEPTNSPGLAHNLKPNPPAPVPDPIGELIVTVQPVEAELLTNGVSLGRPTYPLLLRGLAGHELSLEARLDGYSNAVSRILFPGAGLVANATLSLPRIIVEVTRADGWQYRASPEDLQKSADKGDLGAMVQLADRAFFGLDGKVDYPEALKWYQLAAEKKYPAAYGRMGESCKTVPGFAGGRDEMLRWFQQGAELKDPVSMMELGVGFKEGWAGSKSPRKADELFAAALPALRKSAEAGGTFEEIELGSMSRNGFGVNKDYAAAIKQYRKAADAGNSLGEFYLGTMFQNGFGVGKDYAEARKHYRKAAEAGNADGAYDLGNIYYNGWGVDKDYAEAGKWYRKAATDGNADAQQSLKKLVAPALAEMIVSVQPAEAELFTNGVSLGHPDYPTLLKGPAGQKLTLEARLDGYSNAVGHTSFPGAGLVANATISLQRKFVEAPRTNGWQYQASLEDLQKFASQGDLEAMVQLGDHAFYGLGGKINYSEALRWYQSAAGKKFPAAYGRISSLFTVVPSFGGGKDDVLRWAQQGADLNDPVSMQRLGESLLTQSPAKAQKLFTGAVSGFRQAAEQGDSEAKVRFGTMYMKGLGVDKNYAEALRLYRKAADAGNADAEVFLGYMYYSGLGVDKDYAEAVKWYRNAADAGNSIGQDDLGSAYLAGFGVEKDYAEAVRWYRKAAEAGNVSAENNLGYMYENGWVVGRDREQAIQWYRKAAAGGNADAKANLKRLGQ